jgi:hypothetical protein
VEEVKMLAPFDGKVTWREVLSAEEIKSWVAGRKAPLRLSTELDDPCIYRFIFPEAVDGNARHTPCYVGETENTGMRLRDHFRPGRKNEKRDLAGNLLLKPGWPVRGSIQNSAGDCSLQILKIEGSINLCGVVLDEDSFDDPFARRLLENWTILYSESVDKLRPLNRGSRKSSKIFQRLLRNSSKKNRTKPTTVNE